MARQPITTMPEVDVDFNKGAFSGGGGLPEKGLYRVKVVPGTVEYVPPEGANQAEITFHVDGIGSRPQFVYVRVPVVRTHEKIDLAERETITALVAFGIVPEGTAGAGKITPAHFAALENREAWAHYYPPETDANGRFVKGGAAQQVDLLTPSLYEKIKNGEAEPPALRRSAKQTVGASGLGTPTSAIPAPPAPGPVAVAPVPSAPAAFPAPAPIPAMPPTTTAGFVPPPPPPIAAPPLPPAR